MKLSSQDNQFEDRFRTSSRDAYQLLDLNYDELVSIKIRPIDYFPVKEDDEFWDAYVYRQEYEEILNFLSDNNLESV